MFRAVVFVLFCSLVASTSWIGDQTIDYTYNVACNPNCPLYGRYFANSDYILEGGGQYGLPDRVHGWDFDGLDEDFFFYYDGTDYNCADILWEESLGAANEQWCQDCKPELIYIYYQDWTIDQGAGASSWSTYLAFAYTISSNEWDSFCSDWHDDWVSGDLPSGDYGIYYRNPPQIGSFQDVISTIKNADSWSDIYFFRADQQNCGYNEHTWLRDHWLCNYHQIQIGTGNDATYWPSYGFCGSYVEQYYGWYAPEINFGCDSNQINDCLSYAYSWPQLTAELRRNDKTQIEKLKTESIARKEKRKTARAVPIQSVGTYACNYRIAG